MKKNVVIGVIALVVILLVGSLFKPKAKNIFSEDNCNEFLSCKKYMKSQGKSTKPGEPGYIYCKRYDKKNICK